MVLRMLLLLCMCAVTRGVAAGYELLAAFDRPGTQPLAPLLADADGAWHFTTVQGGAHGLGAVLRTNAAGSVTLVHSFSGPDGAAPVGALAAGPDGTLFGTASAGGTGGFGTVFKLDAAGAFTVVHSFTGSGGAVPQSLMRHSDGNFYGTTLAGGAQGWGTVFRLTAAGGLTTLVEFTGTTGAAKGAAPLGIPIFIGSTLYGVTQDGGASGLGVVYNLSAGGTYTVLAEFSGISGARPGAHPAGGLVRHADGNLYGTTEFGGANDFGTAFRLTPAGAFTSLRAFADPSGSQPAGSLAAGADGALYGTTAAGGNTGLGTVFRLTATGTHTVLAHLTGTAGVVPGAAPRGGPVTGADGDFHFATSAGGPGNNGVIARISPAGTFTLTAALSPAAGWAPSGAPVAEGDGFLFPMHFGGALGGGTLARLNSSGAVTPAAALGGTAGTNPEGALLAQNGLFYGVAARGAQSNRGAVFSFDGDAVTLLSPGTSSGGSLPEGALITGNDGAFYGTAREGGASGLGSLYKVTAAGVRNRVLSFTGTSGTAKGSRPRGALVRAANTSYYGLTETGGAANAGTLFRLSPAGTLSTLAEFTASGPRLPLAGLTAGPERNLYGTTSRGGAADGGTLIRVMPSTNSWSVIAEFTSGVGTLPAGPVLAATDGALYGLATTGGSVGQGTLWRYTAAGGLEALVSFTGNGGATPGTGGLLNGGELLTGGLAMDTAGALYGVTPGGGPGGGGTAFRYIFATPLESWKLSELGDAEAPDLADPDGDAVPTLLEYALLMQPGIRDAAHLPAAAPSLPDSLEITLPRDPARSDVTVTVEAADDPAGPWSTIAASQTGGPFAGPADIAGDAATPGLKSVRIRDAAAPPHSSRRFLRIRVSR